MNWRWAEPIAFAICVAAIASCSAVEKYANAQVERERAKNGCVNTTPQPKTKVMT